MRISVLHKHSALLVACSTPEMAGCNPLQVRRSIQSQYYTLVNKPRQAMKEKVLSELEWVVGGEIERRSFDKMKTD